MFGGYWLLITAVIFIAGLIFHQTFLFLIAILFFLTAGLARLWDHYCLSKVEFKQHLSTHRVFFDEEVTLDIEIANRKPLPLPWIQVDHELPMELTLLKGKTHGCSKQDRVLITSFLSLNWYHKIKRRYHLKCPQRGYFTFGPTKISSGDLFGFFKKSKEVEASEQLIVYPRLVPLESLGILSKQPVGDVRTRNNLFKDPVLTMGIREYYPGDSRRHIHWKSTARSGTLKTRVFEPTSITDMGIFLDVRTVALPYWGYIPELFELAIVTAASMSKYALDHGYRVGLYVNYGRTKSSGLIRIPPSRHPDQLMHILESLAQIISLEATPINELVTRESRNFPWGSTLVAISAVPSDSLVANLMEMKKAGRSVALIEVGNADIQLPEEELPVYHVSGEIDWNNLDSVSMTKAE
jgi:uncharacterized protein (DUF58 family)